VILFRSAFGSVNAVIRLPAYMIVWFMIYAAWYELGTLAVSYWSPTY
jgi:hypothetical protein